MFQWIMEKLGIRPPLEILDAGGDGLLAQIFNGVSKRAKFMPANWS